MPSHWTKLAAEISAQTGTEVVYHDLQAAAFAELLVGAGLPEGIAGLLADTDLGVGRGELLVDTGDLKGLIGRPTTTAAQAIAAVRP